MVMKWAILENLSMMVRMVVFPSQGGSPVMKFTEMWDRRRLGMRTSCPEGARLECLLRAQIGQAETYFHSLMAWISGTEKEYSLPFGGEIPGRKINATVIGAV